MSKPDIPVATQEQESTIEEFTPPKFAWSIGNIAMSAPGGSDLPSENNARRPSSMRMPTLSWPLQAKLEVGAVDDPLEHEADRVAEQVMRMPDPASPAVASTWRTSSDEASRVPTQSASPLALRRKCSCGGSCDKCKAEQADDEHGKVQRKTAVPDISNMGTTPLSSGTVAPPIVHEVLRSPGQPLDAATRAFFEPRFGYESSGVRIHTGADASRSAKEVHARAYTIGNNIVFGSGQYAPATFEGRRLLAHELTHIFQQGATGTPIVRRDPPHPAAVPAQPMSQIEREARVAQIYEEGVTLYLKAKGTPVTKSALGSIRGELTVGIYQGSKNGGELATLVSGNNPKYSEFIKQVLKPEEEFVEPIRFHRLGVRTGQPLKSGADLDVEQNLAGVAKDRGIVRGQISTSNDGCVHCMSVLEDQHPDIRHGNPSKQWKGKTPPKLPKPVRDAGAGKLTKLNNSSANDVTAQPQAGSSAQPDVNLPPELQLEPNGSCGMGTTRSSLNPRSTPFGGSTSVSSETSTPREFDPFSTGDAGLCTMNSVATQPNPVVVAQSQLVTSTEAVPSPEPMPAITPEAVTVPGTLSPSIGPTGAMAVRTANAALGVLGAFGILFSAKQLADQFQGRMEINYFKPGSAELDPTDFDVDSEWTVPIGIDDGQMYYAKVRVERNVLFRRKFYIVAVFIYA